MKNKFRLCIKVTHNKYGYGDRIHIPPEYGLGGTDYVTLEREGDKIVISKVKHEDIK